MPAIFLLLIACTAPPAASTLPADSTPQPRAQPEPVSVALTERAELTLASVEAGQVALGERDIYINTMSSLERQIRMRSRTPVSADDFVEYTQEQVIPWNEEEIKRMQGVTASLAEKLGGLNVPLPEKVLLIKTTGRAESGAAYTRGNVIVFSQGRMAGRDTSLERLLIHELFHVISRHDADLRRKLYAIIGFQPCDPIELPEELNAVKITNPDAPMVDYYISVEHEGEELNVVPILLCDRDEYDPRRKSLFQYLRFRLLAVHHQDGKWQPLLSEGKPVLLDGPACKSYREQIGDNTNYIIHPDEILADNFIHLLMKTKALKSPKIVEKMRAVMSDTVAE